MTYDKIHHEEMKADAHRYTPEAAEQAVQGDDFESMALDWLMSDRVEDFWPDYPRHETGLYVLMEFISCTDPVSQASIAKVLFGVARPEETQLCNHKLGLLVEEYAEKFQERDVRGLL